MSIADWLIRRSEKRPPDFVIGGADRPYLLRWWLTPWRGWTERAKHDRRAWVNWLGKLSELLINAYLHQFWRSDDDRALHTHPWLFNISILLRGTYLEHTAKGVRRREAGDIVFRWGAAAHRIELTDGPVWTLFITGPKVREWGFLCPQGFVHWRIFTAADDRGAIGRGCGE